MNTVTTDFTPTLWRQVREPLLLTVGAALVIRWSAYRPPNALRVFGAFLLGRGLLFRPIVRFILRTSIYPMERVKHRPLEKWGTIPSWKVKDTEQRFIQTQCIKSELNTVDQERKLTIYAGGNGEVYDCNNLDFWEDLAQASERDVVLFNPPGYGQSQGRRSPLADEQALEAVVTTVTKDYNYKAENIRIIGSSIGSGAVSRLAARYPFEDILLFAPFATLSGVITRLVGKWASWSIQDMVREEFEYNNVEYIRQAAQAPKGAKNLTIVQKEDDPLMTHGSALSEAQQLQNAWNQCRTTNKNECKIITSKGGHNDINNDGFVSLESHKQRKIFRSQRIIARVGKCYQLAGGKISNKEIKLLRASKGKISNDNNKPEDESGID